MRNKKVIKMVQMAILFAIIILMAFTPIGFIRTGGLEIQLIMIPVVIGAMTLGPSAGAACGTLFGILSFIQCFGMSPFGATLLNINPIFTFLVCVPSRTIAGYLPGVIFNRIQKNEKLKTPAYFIGGLSGAVINTALFMGLLMLCFWNTEYIQGLNSSLFGNVNIFAFLIGFVGLNGLLEWPVTCIVGGVVGRTLRRFIKDAED